MNTHVSYMYRDGSNYKLQAEAILKGSLTQEEIDEIFKKTQDKVFTGSHFFYPGNIGLHAPTFVSEGYAEYDDDPDWHELLEVYPTDKEATCEVTAAAFLEAARNGTLLVNNNF